MDNGEVGDDAGVDTEDTDDGGGDVGDVLTCWFMRASILLIGSNADHEESTLVLLL